MHNLRITKIYYSSTDCNVFIRGYKMCFFLWIFFISRYNIVSQLLKGTFKIKRIKPKILLPSPKKEKRKKNLQFNSLYAIHVQIYSSVDCNAFVPGDKNSFFLWIFSHYFTILWVGSQRVLTIEKSKNKNCNPVAGKCSHVSRITKFFRVPGQFRKPFAVKKKIK